MLLTPELQQKYIHFQNYLLSKEFTIEGNESVKPVATSIEIDELYDDTFDFSLTVNIHFSEANFRRLKEWDINYIKFKIYNAIKYFQLYAADYNKANIIFRIQPPHQITVKKKNKVLYLHKFDDYYSLDFNILFMGEDQVLTPFEEAKEYAAEKSFHHIVVELPNQELKVYETDLTRRRKFKLNKHLTYDYHKRTVENIQPNM